MSNLNILLLGGNGYIGRHLAESMSNDLWTVYVVARDLKERIKNVHYIVFKDDICKPVTSLIKEKKIDIAINLIGLSAGSLKSLYEANVNTCRDVIHIFKYLKSTYPAAITYHFSSIAIFKYEKKNKSLYSITKFEGENLIRNSGTCNHIVYHSIIDSNVDKIALDLQVALPLLYNEKILDNVEITTIDIDYLTSCLSHFIRKFSEIDDYKDLIILQTEIRLREFIDKILGPVDLEENYDEIDINKIEIEINKANISASSKVRFINFAKLAMIKDPVVRLAKNHYFHFGRIVSIRNDNYLSKIMLGRFDIREKNNSYIVIPLNQ